MYMQRLKTYYLENNDLCIIDFLDFKYFFLRWDQITDGKRDMLKVQTPLSAIRKKGLVIADMCLFYKTVFRNNLLSLYKI